MSIASAAHAVTAAGKLVGAADGGEVAGYQELSEDIPSSVLMPKNKVRVLVDGIPTLALVDTGSTIFVMSVSFKNCLGLKVMFYLSRGAIFRGVRGDAVCPLGVCTMDVSLCGKVFPTEFAVIARSTHDLILGMDILRECGAIVDYRSGHLSVHEKHLPPGLWAQRLCAAFAVILCSHFHHRPSCVSPP